MADAGSTKIDLNLSERYIFIGARHFFKIFTGASLHKDMESILDKVIATMPVSTRRHTRSLDSKIHFQPQGETKSYDGKEDNINPLLTGVIYERYVKFTYRPRSGRKTEGTFARTLWSSTGTGCTWWRNVFRRKESGARSRESSLSSASLPLPGFAGRNSPSPKTSTSRTTSMNEQRLL